MLIRHSARSDGRFLSPGTRVRRGVKAYIESSDRVLLVREQHRDGSLFWTLPGGGVPEHEPLIGGLCRELMEELRVRAVVEGCITSFWYAHLGHRRTVTNYEVFDCRILERPVPRRDDGIFECRWVSPDNPPSGTLPQICTLLRGDDRRRLGGEENVVARSTVAALHR